MPKFIFFIVISAALIIPLLSNPHLATAAVIPCSGTITNQEPAPLEGVKIDLYSGLVAAPRITPNYSKAQGQYAFGVDGFGTGLLETHKIIFSFPGYQNKIILYSGTETGSCPGNITLTPSTSTGYNCNTGRCELVSANGAFSDEASCQADCGTFTYDPGREDCIPDPKGTFYSRKECQSQTPITSVDKYKYNPLKNACVQDPSGSGESLDDCQKKVKASFSPEGCKPGQPNCTSSGGIRCDTSNGDKIDNGDGILTAIGCVPTEPQELIQGLFRVGIGLGGAAALLLMIGGAFQFITSAGNPDAIKSASETFTQAIIGLLVIIFAVLLLQVIGVDILNIPGFGK